MEPLKWFLYEQLGVERPGSCVSATESNSFLFPQLVWSKSGTKHGVPSVCIACLYLICANAYEGGGGIQYVFVKHKNTMAQSSFMEAKKMRFAALDFTSCVRKMAVDYV